MVYIKLAVDMLISLHWPRDPYATFVFLIEQFKAVSECESTTHQQDDDEAMDVVFERSIEPVHTSYYIYLNELIQTISSLISEQQSHSPEITEIFNKNYALICDQFQEELTLTENCLNAKQMRFTDIKYTKLKGQLAFVSKLATLANETNQSTWHKIRLQLDTMNDSLNCLITSHFF